MRAILSFRSVFVAVVVLLGLTLVPIQVSAVDLFPNEVCSGSGSGSVACQESNEKGNPLFGPEGIITRIVFLISVLIAIAAVIIIMLAGFKLITSGSNPQEVTKAREMIIYAIAGIVVAALAQAIVRLFLNVIG